MISHPLIEKKLLNTLTPKELIAFNSLLKTDKIFAEDYLIESEIHQITKTAMNNQETRVYLKELHNKLEEKGALKKNKSVTIKQIFPYMAAALVAGALFFFYCLAGTTHTPEQLYAMNYKPPAFNTQRSTSNEKQLQTAYETKDYNTVIQLLENDIEIDPDLQLYLGISYLETNQTDKAINTFSALQSKSSERDLATWYLALAYLKNKETEKCKTELNKLINEEIYTTQKTKDKARQLHKQL